MKRMIADLKYITILTLFCSKNIKKLIYLLLLQIPGVQWSQMKTSWRS
jgi:hypothetical protein